MRVIASLLEGGFISDTPLMLGDWQTTPLEAVSRLLFELPESKQNPLWAYGLVVKVTWTRASRAVTLRYHDTHPPMAEWGGEAADYKNVGIPLSISAQLLAQGDVMGAGVSPPERAFRAEQVFAELARRGIQIHEEVREAAVVTRV